MLILPHFVIVGAQKCGTTAAARNFALHPQISMFSGITEYGQHEIEFYNQHWDRGIPWYASHFEETGQLRGEKTAELLHRLVCHERLYATNPNYKLVVFLRSPVERSYSQWKMASLRKRDEPNDFDTVIHQELSVIDDNHYRDGFYRCDDTGVSCWREGYILKGFYADQLSHLFKWFPKDQVYVAITERVRSNMLSGYAGIFDFLGVSQFEGAFAEHFVGNPSPPMNANTKALLADLYKQPNERLSSILGEEIPEWL